MNYISPRTIHPYDILALTRSIQEFLVHLSFEVDGLSRVTWGPPSSKCFAASCTPFSEVKCGCFVTGFSDTFVLSYWLLNKMGAICHMIFVYPATKQNVNILSHDFLSHLLCSAGCKVKCGSFVTWFFDIFVRSDRLLSEMWTFVTWFLTHLWFPASFQAKCGRFVTWVLDPLWWRLWFWTHFYHYQLLSETWTFCHIIFFLHVCDDQPAVKGTVSRYFNLLFSFENLISDVGWNVTFLWKNRPFLSLGCNVTAKLEEKYRAKMTADFGINHYSGQSVILWQTILIF